MKAMMRRLTALMMVLSLYTGILALPAAADETASQEPENTTTVTVEIKDSSGAAVGETTTTTTTGASGTTTTTTTTTTDTSGTVTTEQTTTTTTDPSGTLVSEGTSESTTQVQTSNPEAGTTLTETNKDWESQHTQYDPTTQNTLDDNVTQTVEGNTQIEVEGSSENKDIVDQDDNQTHYSGSETGRETVIVTDTTTTTTVTENDLLDSQTQGSKTDESFEEGSYGDPELQTSGDWVRDPSHDVTDTTWETVPGSETDPEKLDTENREIPDPLAGDDEVTLEMDPNGTDSETREISLQDLIPKEGTQSDGSIVKYIYKTDAQGQIVKDKNGNPIVEGYTVTRYGAGMAAADNDENPIVADESTTTNPELVGTTENIVVLPPNYTEGTETNSIQSHDGSITIDTETVTTLLEDGTGYRIVITEVVTGDPDRELSDITGDSHSDFYNIPVVPADAVWVGDTQNVYIQLPTPPNPSTATDPDGTTTTVTVEEIVDSVTGVIIGYKATTTVTGADGTLKSRSSITEYGSLTTFSSRTERDPDTKQVTTVTEKIVTGLQDTQTFTNTTRGAKDLNTTRLGQEDVYQMVETDQGLVFLYQGKMYQVIDNSSNTSNQGIINGETVDVDSFIDGRGEAAANDLRIDGQGHGQHFSGSDFGKTIGSSWTLSGYGLYTDLQVIETNGKTHRPRHFELQRKVNGKIETRYVYCVEMGIDILYGSNYGSTEYKDSGDSNVPWKGATGTIGQIRSVAVNGFWGTENGMGSLEAVKDLMKRNGLDGWEDLTPGMALAATQVAIWEFGAKKAGQFGGYDEDGDPYWEPQNYDFISEDGSGDITDEKMKIVEDLRNLLVKLAYDEKEGKAEEIDGSDITGGAITLKERVAEGSDGKDTYNTDVSFTLDVSTSSLNGDLIVTVKVGGEDVGYARLAGNDKTPSLLSGLFDWGKIYPDDNGTYTIPDVELKEGVIVDLQLTGTQHLDDGVYIFDSGSWQDFVGLSTLERDVDITVSMEFSVTEPELDMEHTRRNWTELKTNKEAYIRTNTLSNSRTGVQTNTAVTITTDYYGTRTQTDVITTVMKVERDWESYYAYTVTQTHQNDQEVKLADPPKTGDTTLILALVSLFSGGAYVLLNRKKEDE